MAVERCWGSARCFQVGSSFNLRAEVMGKGKVASHADLSSAGAPGSGCGPGMDNSSID